MVARMFALVACGPLVIASCAAASSGTIGSGGINASALRAAPLSLNGAGIAIGQVEPGRPGRAGTDAAAFRHDDVVPTAVFRYNLSPEVADATGDVGEHALRVAGVMISQNGGALAGVAPNASLYSSAAPDGDPVLQVTSLNHVARRNSRDVRAINMSYGTGANFNTTDGTSYFTRGVDWIANAYGNTLVVTALSNLV
ncbi:MAG: S8 family serine peptidase [Lacipirellulaceae bacterium]